MGGGLGQVCFTMVLLNSCWWCPVFYLRTEQHNTEGHILMSFLLEKPGMSQWVRNLLLGNHRAVPCNYGQAHKNWWRWEWERAAVLGKKKLGTLIIGRKERIRNKDPKPWLGMFRSVRLLFFPFYLMPKFTVWAVSGILPLNTVKLYQDINGTTKYPELEGSHKRDHHHIVAQICRDTRTWCFPTGINVETMRT